MPQFSPTNLFLSFSGLLKNTQLAKSNRQSPWIFVSNRQQNKGKDICETCNFRIPEVTCHEFSNKKITKGKTTIFTNILTEIYCGRDHWKYERPFVNKEFHMRGVLHSSRNPYPISDQNLWFSLPNFRPAVKNLIPYFRPGALESGEWPERVTSCLKARTRQLE